MIIKGVFSSIIFMIIGLFLLAIAGLIIFIFHSQGKTLNTISWIEWIEIIVPGIVGIISFTANIAQIVSTLYSVKNKPDYKENQDHFGIIENKVHINKISLYKYTYKYYYQSQNVKPPLQKPLKVKKFLNREKEMNKLLIDLQPGRIITLYGPGGMGKTTLARAAIWQLAPGVDPPKQFPDGIIFYKFHGKSDINLVFEHILRSFDDNIREYTANTVRRVLGRKQALIVLDGTEEANNLPEILDACSGNCGLLLTTRRANDAPSDILELEPLNEKYSIQLLKIWSEII